jgi:hypothetical protein
MVCLVAVARFLQLTFTRWLEKLNTRCLYVYDFSGFNRSPCGKFICFCVKICFHLIYAQFIVIVNIKHSPMMALQTEERKIFVQFKVHFNNFRQRRFIGEHALLLIGKVSGEIIIALEKV